MRALLPSRNQQQGVALIAMLTVIVMGFAWYTVGALGKAPRSTAEREIRTGHALHTAKAALLHYLATEAARSDNDIPGRLPCPEPLSPASGSEGIAAGCSSNTTTYIGRLPWRTLGIEPIRDGDGEALWYILGRGFRQSPINLSSLDEIELDGVNRQAVALIIAPGRPLNSMNEPGSPPASCPRVNQYPRPVVPTFDPAKFLECGRNSVPSPGNEPQYVTTNAEPWTNDRILAVTAEELMAAIGGPVADRLQRQVAPALETWRSGESLTNWGISFLPYASTFTDPTTNDLCGNNGVTEGLLPTAAAAAGTCAAWNSGSSSNLVGLLTLGCSSIGTHMRCRFLSLFGGLFSARITATAPNVAGSFRGRIDAASISVSNGGSVQNFNLALDAGSGAATTTFDVTFPLLSLFSVVTVLVPNLPDASILADARLVWFLQNGWNSSFTYYSVSGSAVVAPTCVAGAAGCLMEVRGLPVATGAHDNKRLALILAGPALAGQTRACPAAGCGNLSNFLEEQNASASDGIFRADLRIANPAVEVPALTPPYAALNDRAAACPLQYSGHAAICN